MKAHPSKAPKRKDANIRSRTDGLYDVDVQITRPDGHRWRKRAFGLKSKEKARLVRDQIYEQFNVEVLGIKSVSVHVRSGGPTLHHWLDACLREYWPKRIPQTVRGYRTSVNQHILPYAPDVPLKDLKPVDLQHFVEALNAARPDLSVSTVRAAVGCLKSSLTVAVELSIIERNPYRGISVRWRNLERERTMRGQRTKQRRNLLEKEELDSLLSAAEGTIYFPVVLLQSHLGLRVGEALALSREDFDFRRETVKIDKQLKRVEVEGGSELRLVPPKTEKGVREIPLPKRVLEYACECEGLICPGKSGGWIDPDNVKNRLALIANEIGLKGVSSHSLRHTWISRLLNEERVPPSVVRDLAGHSNISTTLNYYSHSSDAQLREAMSKL